MKHVREVRACLALGAHTVREAGTAHAPQQLSARAQG